MLQIIMIASNYSNKVDDIIVMMKWINNNKNKMMEWCSCQVRGCSIP